MTIQDVAYHLGVGWDTIKDIQKRDLQHRFKKPSLGKLKHLADRGSGAASRLNCVMPAPTASAAPSFS
jgi:hypothetical protein